MDTNQSFIRWSEIEPLCVLWLLIRKAWLIVLAALIGTMAASIITTSLISRTFSCTATFVVTPRIESSYYINVSAAGDVAALYSKLLQSSVMSQTVNEELDGMNGSISAVQLGETNLIRVTATSESPKDALLIIQTIIENYADLSDYVSATAVLSVLDTPSLTALHTQTLDEGRIRLYSSIACAGIMVCVLLWLAVSSGTVHNSTGAKHNLDAKIIASVPHEKSKKLFRPKAGKRLRGNLNIGSPAISFSFVESIHHIAAKFEHERAKGKKVFLFSSVSEAEGKSTLAANTAISLCEHKNRLLFIDLDLRRPVQDEFFGVTLKRSDELGTLLAAGASPAEILDAAIVNPETGMSTLLSSKSYVDMIELIASPILAQVIDLARSRYDYVIIDSPPLGYFADSELLSDLSDASVLVVRQDTASAPDINDAIDALRAGKAEFLGCILNDMRHLRSYLQRYGYGYGYGNHSNKYSKHRKYGYTARNSGK